MTRTVWVGERWAIKVPRLHLLHGEPGARVVHCELGWALRGWLANRSEWRQRHRPDVACPVFTLFHVALVMPAAEEVGDDRAADPGPGPWAGFEDIDDGRLRDERKPSSWGRFGARWLIIDYDRAWEAGDRGLIGGLYFGHQERLARRWARPE